MSKHDLRARPIFHHTHDATWAHLTVVMASLALARYLQDTTRISIKRVTGAPLTGSRTARSFLTGDDLNEPGEARVVVVLEGPEGLSQEPRLPLVLVQTPVVEGLGRVEHDEGHDAVVQALLEHEDPPHSTVAVLKGVDGLEAMVEVGDVVKGHSRWSARNEIVDGERDVLGCHSLASAHHVGNALVVPDGERRPPRIGGPLFENSVVVLTSSQR